jgi:hypothetical protein
MLLEVRLQGTTSLLQNRRVSQRGLPPTRGRAPREAAESRTYRDHTGGLCLPGEAVKALLARTARRLRPSCGLSLRHVMDHVEVVDRRPPLYAVDGRTRLHRFEVDTKAVSVGFDRNVEDRHRPRLDEWVLHCLLRREGARPTLDELHWVFTEAGKRVGLGDERAETGGCHGTFVVVPGFPREVP